MIRRSILLVILLVSLRQCVTPTVELTGALDPDIAMVNIGEGDRAEIGRILQAINKYKPAVIAINAIFIGEKDHYQDSVLVEALKAIPNDILIYNVDEKGKEQHSHEKFLQQVTAEGFSRFVSEFDLVSYMMPVQKIKDSVHELFPLTIVREWKPGFQHRLSVNKTVKINYRRQLPALNPLEPEYLYDDSVDSVFLRNKVVLVGYLGPKNEDKCYTPLRLVKDKNYPKDQPDNYRLVVIANAIRTILDYEKKND